MMLRTFRLVVAAGTAMAVVTALSADAHRPPVIDGVKVKWLNLSPTETAATPTYDLQRQVASAQSTQKMDCTNDPCWTSTFKYAPAKALVGSDRDVLVTVNSSGIYDDIDLFVLDAKGNQLGTCGRPVSNQEQVYLPYTALKARKTYTVVVEFVTTAPKPQPSSQDVAPYFTQGEVQLPSPVHQQFSDQDGQHALNSCGSEDPFP